MGLLSDLLTQKDTWRPNPVLTDAIEAAKDKAATKVSRTEPNLANDVAAHIRRIAPELALVPNLWFSGSNVWRILYGETPADDADIDVFFAGPHRLVTKQGILGDVREAADELVKTLGIQSGDSMHSPVRTGRNEDLYGVGIKALWRGKKLDIWAGGETVAETLNNYPSRTHAHCRAAFSFTEGLVVLPTEAADGSR
jgi:hypothetical protein